MTADATALPAKKNFSERMLDGIEKAGNKIPHPVIMFLYLIAFIAVLSAVLSLFDISVTEEIVEPVPIQELVDLRDALGGSIIAFDVFTQQEAIIPEYVIVEETISIKNLLNVEGLRFIFTSFVNNVAGFGVIAVILVAMAGVGVAEASGLMAALIRKLVAVAPRQLIAFILIFVGVVSSVATDAGYLILIPLSAAAFVTLGRHPLAGLAASFAGVSAVFAVNVLITPTDAMLTEITNEAIGLAGGEPLTITANYFFAAVSSVVLAIVAVLVTTRVVEPRLGTYDPGEGDPSWISADSALDDDAAAAEARGLRYSFYGLLVMVAVIGLATVPPGAPLRDPVTGGIIGPTPFMASLIFIITLIFLVCGIFYGLGAKTISNSNQVVDAVTKTFSGLSGLIFMLLMIAQFIAYFNYTNMPRIAAVEMAQILERADVGALPLLIGMILVIVLLNIILPGVVPKWAIFAPVFIPIFYRLGVAPQTVLASYRIGDSPTNVLTPLMVYLPFIVTVAQRYDKKAGLGTIVALMLPYAAAILIAWIILFSAWFILDLPLGPGFPVNL